MYVRQRGIFFHLTLAVSIRSDVLRVRQMFTTVIVRKRAQYRPMLSRRGLRQSRLILGHILQA